MADRRRINGPPSGTVPPVYAAQLANPSSVQRPRRTRPTNQLRKIFIRTGLTPSASGSAYLELQSPEHHQDSLTQQTSSLKIACTVHGPKPLPRSAPFSPQLILTTSVKFAPYASRNLRRGYVRDAVERDLGVHLESALRGVVIGDRWPKSGVEVVVTVLEAEEDAWWLDEARFGAAQSGGIAGTGSMVVLGGCITAASAAILSAGIDCVDVIVGGVSAVVETTDQNIDNSANSNNVVLDPCPSEHQAVRAACVVGYLASRDELTEIWMKGDVGGKAEVLIDKAVDAAIAAKSVLEAVITEAMQPTVGLNLATDDSKALEIQETPERNGKGLKSPKGDIVMT